MTSQKNIALSAGGKVRELEQHGIGLEHVNEFMVRLARPLLQKGHRLVFGGSLNRPGEELTQKLIDAAIMWHADSDANARDKIKPNDNQREPIDLNHPQTWPLTNFIAWPYLVELTDEQQAGLVGACQFIKVLPDGHTENALNHLAVAWQQDQPPGDVRNYDKSVDTHTANTLSKLRRESTEHSHLRIALAGTVSGAAGWLPGVAEEVLYSLRAEKPVLILGLYAGCAGLLANFLSDQAASWPEEFTLEFNRAHNDYPNFPDAETEEAVVALYDELATRMAHLKQSLAAGEAMNGIAAQQFTELLQERSARAAIAKILAILDELS